MSVIPSGYQGGTTLNTPISSYEALALRIKHQLGFPLINLEIADEQIYDNITDAIQYFTKWAGYTEEFLVFDSRLYTRGVGMRLDQMVNITPELITTYGVSALSAGWDYDLNDYRKINDCFSFNYGESTGINTLFTMEQAMAQQIYSSYMVGNFGFDLTSWEILKGFIETRNRVLAQTPHFRFDNRTQILRIIPEPLPQTTYMGVVGCYIERPIADLVKERWVQKYVLNLCLVSMSRVRKKYNGTSLMGGGTVDASELERAIQDLRILENELMNNYQDATPGMFFLGIFMAMMCIGSLMISNMS